MHVLRDQWVARSISQVDAAVLQEAVDREPFQQIEAIASRSQSPTSATKSAMAGPSAMPAGLPEAIAVTCETVVVTLHAQGAQIYECKAGDNGQLG